MNAKQGGKAGRLRIVWAGGFSNALLFCVTYERIPALKVIILLRNRYHMGSNH